MSSVLVVMEQASGGGWHRISREALAAGKRLAAEIKVPCAAVVLGTSDALATVTAQLAGEGVETVWAVEEAACAKRPPGPPEALAVLAVLAVSGGASASTSAAAP